ncbi:hypothetical protein DXG03_004139, partial [Asterophora parasitica]
VQNLLFRAIDNFKQSSISETIQLCVRIPARVSTPLVLQDVRNLFCRLLPIYRRYESEDLNNRQSSSGDLFELIPLFPHVSDRCSGRQDFESCWKGQKAGSRSRQIWQSVRPPVRGAHKSALDAFVGTGSSTGSKKRKNNDSEDTQDPKRRPTDHQAQLAAYALDSLNASSRHYVCGSIITDFKVSLWYFDRACVIGSSSFSFNENPSLLALVLYAFSTCSDEAAGFDPLLKFPSTNERLKRPIEEPTPQHYQDVINSVVSLPRSTVQYRILETLYAYRGLLGCGTMFT